MKESVYNYYTPYGEHYLFFNGRTKRIFQVSKKNADKFQEIICNPDIYKEDCPVFISKMKEDGFILEDGVNELDLVKELYHELRFPEVYQLMILPTYRCNLSCWYCLQRHQNIDLTPEHVRRIKLHIRKYLQENQIKIFYLTWFGGEPLLRYDIIVDLSSYALQVCQEMGIQYKCGITTNGLLLNEERIKEMERLHFKHFQITIDGCEEEHNKVKHLKGINTFGKTLKNIATIVREIPKVDCCLRINYSDQTLAPEAIMQDINKYLPEELHSLVRINLQKIWQVRSDKINKEKISDLGTQVSKSNFTTSTLINNICYVDYIHFNCVFPNGKLGKCDNEGLNEQNGEIAADGSVHRSEKYLFEDFDIFSEKSQCATCKHLPSCWGPCPQKKNQSLMQHGTIKCIYKKPEQRMKNLIEFYGRQYIKREKTSTEVYV